MNGISGGTERAFLEVGMNGSGVVRRRDFLRTIGWGAAGVAASAIAPISFPEMLALQAEELRKREMACILLWMAGGPSQFETFDPKPGTEHGGETKVIDTAAAGIKIAQGWEKTAKMMNEITLVRSMTNKEGNHQRASYQLHTGYPPTATVKHPHIGCSAANERSDPKFDLPHVVSIGGPTVGAGFLGVGLEPFVIQSAERPPANARPLVSDGRFRRRLGLLGKLESTGFGKAGGADRVNDHQSLYRQTSRMVLSPRMKAFNLEGEDAQLRDAYGRTPFGQGCLLARRLVEAGVSFIEVKSNGWDTHQEVNDRVGKLAGQVDPAFATLIGDLKRRGMLDKTLVIWMGEFGRTPKINPSAGRDHFPRVFNVALAGGGVKGGQVVGSSSADGTEVKDRPVTVPDLMASFCHALKVDPTREVMTPVGRPIKVVDGGKTVSEIFG